MKRISSLLCGVGLLASAAAWAQEVGTVISSQPVVQQLAVPRQVCQTEQSVSAAPPSGAGAIIGAIAGGVVGSAFGGGSGHALATAVGALGGAVAGNQIESRPQVQTVQHCSTQTFYENRAVAYNVVYEYAGRRYSVQMPNDPGPTVQLQVTPVAPTTMVPPVQAPARIISSTTYVQPGMGDVTVLPPTTVYSGAPVVTTTYVTPSYYSAPSYVAPLTIGLGIGYIGGRSWGGYHGGPRHHGGYHGGPRHHGGWRH